MRHVIISGLTASGKTTQSLQLAKDLVLHYISGSAIRAELLGVDEHVSSNQFWRESTTAETLDETRLARPDTQDTAVENKLIEIASKSEGCVFDTWVLPWLFQTDSLCVFLKSALETRARRLFRNSWPRSFEDSLRTVEQKDNRARDFFLMAYGVDIFQDLSPFDVIIECDEHDDEVAECIAEISYQLAAIARPTLSGGHDALRAVVRSLGQHTGSVKTYVKPSLIDRLGQSRVA